MGRRTKNRHLLVTIWIACLAFPALGQVSETPRPGEYLITSARPLDPLKEQVVRIPMTIGHGTANRHLSLEATVYRPEGAGPFPLLVLSHGTPRDLAQRRVRQGYEIQSWVFVNMGFAVVIPMRRSYAHSEGDYAEEEGDCDQAQYYEAGRESASDLLATVRYMRAQPYINPNQVVLAGHSAGGFASLALASQGFDGLLGVINLGGGRGSRADRVCSPQALIAAFGKFGRTTRVPTLWIYAQNDTYFKPSLVRQLHRAFTREGGQARLVMLPPFSGEGHYLFTDVRGLERWTGLVQSFIDHLGVPRPH